MARGRPSGSCLSVPFQLLGIADGRFKVCRGSPGTRGKPGRCIGRGGGGGTPPKNSNKTNMYQSDLLIYWNI